MSLETWTKAELLCPADGKGQVEPRVQIWPVRGRLMAVDLPWRRGSAPPADFVVPPGPLTLQLADLSIDRPCMTALDLGTGSGTLHDDRSAPRPFMPPVPMLGHWPSRGWNLRLNGMDDVHCLAGNLFDPVAERQFDLILCNPPFVISPTQRFSFRDSGMRGDLLCRRLVAAAIERLAPGGYFQCTGNIAPYRRPFVEGRFGGMVRGARLRRGSYSWARVGIGGRLRDELDPRPESKDPRQVSSIRSLVRILRTRADRGRQLSLYHNAEDNSWRHDRHFDRRSTTRPAASPGRADAPEVLRFFQTRDAFSDPSSAEALLEKLGADRAGHRSRRGLSRANVVSSSARSASTRPAACNIRWPCIAMWPRSLQVRRPAARCRELLVAEMVASLDLSWEQAVPVILPAVRALCRAERVGGM